MDVSRLAVVVLAASLGCNVPTSRAPSGGTTASTSAPLTAIPPPGPAAIGTTSALIASTDGVEAYWPLNDVTMPDVYNFSVMSEVTPGHVNGYWDYGGTDDLTPAPGPLAGDPSTAALFRGDRAYGHVDSHKVFSLTRTWDYFDQGVDPYLGYDWGYNARGEPWVAEVTTDPVYGITYGVEGDNSGVAFIDPGGSVGSFQQGIPSTTLLTGEMQILTTWDFAPANATGILEPVALVAQEISIHTHAGANLIEHLADHTMELDLVQTVGDMNTPLGSVILPWVNEPGAWWFVRYRFDGATYSARAWRKQDREPSEWQVTGTAGSAQTGSTAVRYENSSASYQPKVYYDDFWVQTIGFSFGMFVRVPRVVQTDVGSGNTQVYAASKAVGTGSYQGNPGDPFAPHPGGNGQQEYYYRLDAELSEDGGTLDGYALKGYTFNIEGSYGAGRSFAGSYGRSGPQDFVTYDKWYYVVTELDPGDFNDPDAGIRVWANGLRSGRDSYRGDGSCPDQCKLDGNDTVCPGYPDADICWMITPLSSDGALEVGRGLAHGFDAHYAKYFDGTVGDMAVFSRQLSCEEISNIYNSACVTQDAPIPSGLYATASSYAPPFPPANAVDGTVGTGWTSAGGGIQSFTVDLGQARDIAMIELQWGDAFAQAYEVQISSDGVSWNTIGSVPGLTNEKCLGVPVSNGDGATDAVCIQANARWIQIFMAESVAASGQFTLNEFQVFACDVAAAACQNNYPFAVVGPQRFAFEGQTVTLDGSQSFDGDNPGHPLGYAWSLAGPSSSSATLSNADAGIASFTPLVAGIYSATLVVTDDGTPPPVNTTNGFYDVSCPGFDAGTCPASSYPATTVVTVLPVKDFIPQQLTNDLAFVAQLTPADVTAPGNQQAFSNLLQEAQAATTAGKYAIASQKVQSALERTDGWSLRGAPDAHEPGRDWIVSQAAATYLYGSLTQTLAALQTL